MFNIYVVHDLLMFNIPSVKLSPMHIVLNHVVLTLCILLSQVTRLLLLKLEIEHKNVMYLIKHANLHLSVYACICMSICMYIFK